jgi:capsular exopolysaccharide synthesis family protein
MVLQQEAASVMDERAITPRQPLRGLQRFDASRSQEPQREWLFAGADELFRGLYTRAGIGFTSEVLAVSSAIGGEGKTTVALGLAVTVAQDYPERRVLLVETDFQRPTLAGDFGVDATPGLVDCILGDEPLELAFRSSFLDNLHLLPVGGPAPGPGRALRSSRMASIVDSLRQSYDLVVIDAPSILVNSDSVMLMDLADSAVLVVRTGLTPQPIVNKAIEQIDETKLRGIVLNGSHSAIPGWLRRLCGM